MWWWPENGLATIRISWKCAFGRNTFVETILLLVLVSCGRVTRSWAAILYLSVPRTINVDQINEAILDCQYDYSHNLDDFLVVKWFLNDNEQPIYTWLPHSNSRAFHPLYETFIDKTYTFSAESYEIYRGIRFSHLHPNLTGIYLCSVSSKWGHFEERKPMTLYRNPNFMRFDLKVLSFSVVSIECDVERLMRPAEVRVYRIEDRYFAPVDADVTVVPMPNDRMHSIIAMVRSNYTVSQATLKTSSVLQFQCAVFYPNSGVNMTQTKLVLMKNEVSLSTRRQNWIGSAILGLLTTLSLLVCLWSDMA